MTAPTPLTEEKHISHQTQKTPSHHKKYHTTIPSEQTVQTLSVNLSILSNSAVNHI
jgi:hypothetical protein